MNTICGCSCDGCGFKDTCGGCAETDGKPFGKKCMISSCCHGNGFEACEKCSDGSCSLKQQLIDEFNALGIEDMATVTDLNALKGSYINLEYTMPGGQKLRFWDDDKVYLGNQIEKKGGDRCYGLTADENYLLVCEYGAYGADAEIVVYKRRNK